MIERYTTAYWLERAQELAEMAERAPSEEAARVLRWIAAGFAELGQLPALEIAGCVGEWDRKRRKDFLELITEIPFSEMVKGQRRSPSNEADG